MTSSQGDSGPLSSPGKGRLLGTGRLTVTVKAGAHFHHHLVTTEVIRRARRARLAGATVLCLGEGATSRVPHAVVLVDRSDRLAGFAASLSDLEGKLSCNLEPVEVLFGPAGPAGY